MTAPVVVARHECAACRWGAVVPCPAQRVPVWVAKARAKALRAKELVS